MLTAAYTDNTRGCTPTKLEQDEIIKARQDVTETEFHQHTWVVVAMSQI
ncbi:hypothetical protein NTGBS_180056 [Candidatus Nitrotoga sp. BS]|nr:hypothetical protein NTGBS_180056 [Candidatus Nitrotoga sp. BS]